MTAHDLRRGPVAPSLELASRLLHDYAELQRASDRMLVSSIELGINPLELGQAVSIQREMLGGFLCMAIGQVDMLRIMAREPGLAQALAMARNEAPQRFDLDDPANSGASDEMGPA